MLTLANLKSHVTHALGGGEPAAELSSAGIVNEAGRFLFSMHPWEFRSRPPVAIDFIADQSYAALPDDFGNIVGYSMTDGLNTGLTLTTIHDLVQRRTGSTGTPQTYWGAIVQARSANRARGLPPVRLELYPTPTETSRGALTLAYLADWVDLVDDADVAQVEPFVESLLIALVRAFAKGYEEDEVGTIDARLQQVRDGYLFASAVQHDGMKQMELGPIQNGAAATTYETFATGFTPVADPS